MRRRHTIISGATTALRVVPTTTSKWQDMRIAVAMSLCMLAGVASAQTIGVFADSTGNDCNLVAASIGVPVRAYVVVTVDHTQIDDGFTTSAFQIHGLPPGWQSAVIATPGANLALGNPFANGLLLARPNCERSTRYLIAVLELIPSSVATNQSLTVLAHPTYGNCGFESSGCSAPCPLLCGCGDLFRFCECLTSVSTSINGASCQVATEKGDWGRLKRMYR